MLAEEHHIGWGEKVKCHDGRDVPEGQFIISPEVPVDGELSDQVDPVAGKSWNVIQAGDDQPCWIDADETPPVEPLDMRRLHPREPKSYPTEEQEDVHADISAAMQPEKHIVAGQGCMEEDDEQHR